MDSFKRSTNLIVKLQDENANLKYQVESLKTDVQSHFDGIWRDIENEKPKYYEPVLVMLKNGDQHEAWMASDGENEIWTKLVNNDILKSVQKWMRYE